MGLNEIAIVNAGSSHGMKMRGEGVLPWRSGESGDGVGELAGFGYISLKRMWFMRGIRLLPILPISTARHNDALLLRCSDAVVGRSMPRSGVE